MSEMDVITQLIDMEKEATRVLQLARSEAENKINEARAIADAEYKAAYDAIIDELENQFKKDVKDITEKHDVIFDHYQEDVVHVKKDKKAFELFVDSILFKS